MSNISGPEFFFKAPEIEVSRWITIPHQDSYFFVGNDGSRFTAENRPCMGADRHGKTKVHGAWMQQLTPVPVDMIFDEAFRKAGSIGESFACWDVTHGNRYDWSADNLREVDKGWIKRANTIGDLAALINLAPEMLEATANRYNAFARAGTDADYSRSKSYMAPL